MMTILGVQHYSELVWPVSWYTNNVFLDDRTDKWLFDWGCDGKLYTWCEE